jgi:hypothetical protein
MIVRRSGTATFDLVIAVTVTYDLTVSVQHTACTLANAVMLLKVTNKAWCLVWCANSIWQVSIYKRRPAELPSYLACLLIKSLILTLDRSACMPLERLELWEISMHVNIEIDDY